MDISVWGWIAIILVTIVTIPCVVAWSFVWLMVFRIMRDVIRELRQQ